MKLFNKNSIAALLAVGVMAVTIPCIADDTSTDPEPIKQEQKAAQIKKEKNSLEKKLEFIGNFYDEKELNYCPFHSTLENGAEVIYLLAREDIDHDGIKDYILIIGERKKNEGFEYPGGPGSIYIEDRSKNTGLGTVDDYCFYGKVGNIGKIVKYSNKDFPFLMAEYVDLMGSDPSNREKIIKLREQIVDNRKALRDANLIYSNKILDAVEALKIYIDSKK